MASLALTDEEQMARTIARDFCARRSPVAQLRKLRDDPAHGGFDPALWREMVSLGWSAVPWPEADGGLGAGYRMLGVITEETGRTLVASPLLTTAWIGGTALAKTRHDTAHRNLLALIARGEMLIALAHEEGDHHDPYRIATTFREGPDGYIINGHKTWVLDGQHADYLIVVVRAHHAANDREGISLLLVAANTPGVLRTNLTTVDSRAAAAIRFDDVTVGKDALLAPVGQGADLLDAVLDVARIGLACEALGALQACFDRSVAYLKERIQFGVPIGSFQALKHRAAMLFCEVELAKSCVLWALDALDEAWSPDAIARRASMAKAKVSQVFHDVACEAIQFFGGYGMTDECEIGFFLKRAAVVAQLFGSPDFHRDRFARLQASPGGLAMTSEDAR